ncbi:unnamed protein product, partial [Effrenium voratum]
MLLAWGQRPSSNGQAPPRARGSAARPRRRCGTRSPRFGARSGRPRTAGRLGGGTGRPCWRAVRTSPLCASVPRRTQSAGSAGGTWRATCSCPRSCLGGYAPRTAAKSRRCGARRSRPSCPTASTSPSCCPLDFVVGGLASCGTTTVAKTLAQAPDIDFTVDGEDDFFYQHDSLLPYRAEVEAFNFGWLRRDLFGRRGGVLGLRHPGLFHSHRVRLALQAVPRLKMILVVCDPLSRFEKLFWAFHQCKANAQARLPVGPERRSRCFHSARAALEEPELLLRAQFGPHLRQLRRLLPERLRAVHQAHFREGGSEAFRSLARFLSARSPEFQIARHNHHGGHRSDLCHNASLVSELQARLSSEYQAVEELLDACSDLPLPQELLLRQTRCDRAEELAEPEAPEPRPLPRLVPLDVGSLVFNALVLYGNTMTSSALKEVGESTRGWSNVGNGIASSLKTEIDVVMNNVSIMLLDSLEHVSGAQGQLEMVLSMVGNETDNAVAKHPELSLLQEHGPEKGLALLQEKHGKNESHVEALVPLVLTAVHQVLEVVMSKVSEGLHTLMIKIKPALIQVGKWIQQFGAKVQAGLEDFSLTLDKAQKMFDQVMAQMKGTANNSDQMMFETWPIFDDDGSGSVSATELSNVGDWFSISALQGKKAPELVKKYDTSGDGTLERKEFHALVNDPSIPGSLSVILRKYAKRLAEIAGQVGRALMRDDVANSVAAYVRLVCAKNMTKVGWISDRLGNGSVPLDFTGTVFVEMCLAAKDPNAQVYTSADTGLILTQEVYNLHPEAMLQAVDLMSNASWWTGQGYNLQDQPACVKMATGWITQVESGNGVSLLGLGQSGTEEEQFLSQMPEAAYMLAEEGVKLYRLQRLQARQQRRAQLYTSQTSQLLLQRLLGGQSPTDGTSEETQAAATGGGVPAVNSTLEFAQFLEWNATDRAKELQRYSFDYSSESSNAIDDFASKIQAMIKKVSSFISLMEKYSTEKGITDLENQVEQFLNNALEDVSKTIEQKLAGLITANAPKLDQAIHAAAHSAGERLGAMIGQVISSPMIQALEAPLEEVLSSSLGNATGASIGSTMSASLGMEISNLTAGTLGAKLGDALEGLVDDALEKAGE